MAKLSVVILNWNGKKYLFDCVESIVNQTFKDYEVIIVDNASTDGSHFELKAMYPQFTYIFNKENTGFARGMNIGVNACSGEYVALLNNDIHLEKDFFANAVSKFEQRRDISGIHGQAYDWIDKKCTDIKQGGVSFLKHRVQGTSIMSDEEMYSFGPHGSFVLLTKQAVDDVINKSGYCYDEAFGTGWEDTDLWFRLQLFGHKTLFVPSVVAWHVGSASADEQKRLVDKSLDYQTRIFRNRFYVIKKNYTKEMMRKEWLNLLIANMLLLPYYLIKSPVSLKAVFRGWREYKKNIKEVKIKRDLIRENTVVDYSYTKTLYKGF